MAASQPLSNSTLPSSSFASSSLSPPSERVSRSPMRDAQDYVRSRSRDAFWKPTPTSTSTERPTIPDRSESTERVSRSPMRDADDYIRSRSRDAFWKPTISNARAESNERGSGATTEETAPHGDSTERPSRSASYGRQEEYVRSRSRDPYWKPASVDKKVEELKEDVVGASETTQASERSSRAASRGHQEEYIRSRSRDPYWRPASTETKVDEIHLAPTSDAEIAPSEDRSRSRTRDFLRVVARSLSRSGSSIDNVPSAANTSDSTKRDVGLYSVA